MRNLLSQLGIVSALCTVLVANVASAAIFVDFGTTASSSPPFNNIADGAVHGLEDTANNATGISGQASGFSGGGTSGASSMTGDAAAAFGGSNPNAAIDFNFANAGVTGTFLLTGLNSLEKYTFTIFGARNNGNTTLFSTYTATGANSASGSLQTYRSTGVNTDQVVVLSDIVPNAQNRISLTVTNATGFSYINAVRIDAAPVPEPASIAAAAAGAGLLLVRRRRN